jgi:hypothetical protein
MTFIFWSFYTETEIAENLSPLGLVEKRPRRGDYTALNMYFGGYNTGSSFATYPVRVGIWVQLQMSSHLRMQLYLISAV